MGYDGLRKTRRPRNVRGAPALQHARLVGVREENSVRNIFVVGVNWDGVLSCNDLVSVRCEEGSDEVDRGHY